MRSYLFWGGLACIVVGIVGCREDARPLQAASQVSRWADKLDAQTTETGAYIRHPANQLPENDPWGSPLTVSYAQGGINEVVTVRSFGPDQQSHTEDDIVEIRMSANLNGAGEGIKKNIEETSQNAARGLVKGAIEGVKDSIKKDPTEDADDKTNKEDK